MGHISKIDKDLPLPAGMSRRAFLKRMGGGLIIAVSVSDFSMLYGNAAQDALPEDVNAYLKIRDDGIVDCFTGKIEMGQGPITSLAQTIAEELDTAVDSVHMVMGDTALCPYDAGTWGSQTTRRFGPVLRAAAAKARAMLVEMASGKMGVPVTGLTVENGVVYAKHDKTKSIAYSELTAGENIVHTLKKIPPLKSPEEFKIIGKPMKHMDALEKVTGQALYAGDIKLPGMKFATVLRPTVHGGRLKHANTASIKNIEGIEWVMDGDFFAVLHDDIETAWSAALSVEAEFENPEIRADQETIFDYLEQSGDKFQAVSEGGDLEVGRRSAKSVERTRFLDGYVAHAPIEPHTATAVMEGDTMIIWASTQTPFGARKQVASALDMPLDKVHLKEVFIGGGFGGKIASPQVVEAARIAKLSGKPVQLVYSRREEFFEDTYRPAAVVNINSGVDDRGNIVLWDYDVYFAGARGSQLFYDFPNQRVRSVGSKSGNIHPFNTGAWRAPGHNTNTFARESQIDILAARAGIDPLQFRLNHITDEKMLRVLKAAGDRFGWTPSTNFPSGRGYGIACGIDAGTYVAVILEAAVDRQTGQVRVKRAVAAQDMGMVVNPQGATIQVEGCIVMGLGYALSEDIEFEGGEIKTRNFDSYELPRISWTPEKIDTVLIDAMHEPPQGGGEPAIVCMGGAVANAIYDACGARVMRMPMTPERVLAALG
jgi:CO/xanthine dehydrogenase Mo-binding subunit